MKSIREVPRALYAGRNASPTSAFSACTALPSMVLMASGVVALMMNSCSMLPVHALGSLTAASISFSRSRFCVTFAPPSMAHWPNRAFRVDSFSSPGRFPMASKTFSRVPVPSVCMAFATPSAVMPSRAHAASWFAVAMLPLLMLV